MRSGRSTGVGAHLSPALTGKQLQYEKEQIVLGLTDKQGAGFDFVQNKHPRALESAMTQMAFECCPS